MTSKTFFYEFGRLLYKIDGYYAEYAKKSKVKENLLWVLYALNDGNEHSQKEIADTWDLPRTTVNTIIKELEEDNYIELSQIKGEKRELNVILTSSGKKYADDLLKDLYKIENYVFDKLKNTNALDELKEILDKLNEAKEQI